MPFQGKIFTFLAQNNSRSFCLLGFFTTLQGRSHIHTTMKKTISFLDYFIPLLLFFQRLGKFLTWENN